MLRHLLLSALLLGACETAPPRTPEAGRVATIADPPTPFDSAVVVIDTTEPPEQVVQIPPRPEPPPRPPLPRPMPPSAPLPLRVSAGRCDVRTTENYCFAYTGDAWTPESARAQCDAAPDASFAPGVCPLAGRVATCVFERETAPGQEIVYTYYAPYELALAELACPGTFTRIE